MELNIKKIGLAAYMKMNGCKLIGYTGDFFTMSDPEGRTMDGWELNYSNSCCQRHDAELLLLRDTVRRHNRG